jgi:energy-coupling factor transporter transmembrane protein EcfT
LKAGKRKAHSVHIVTKGVLFLLCAIVMSISDSNALFGLAILLGAMMLWLGVYPLNPWLVVLGGLSLVAVMLDRGRGSWLSLGLPLGRLACLAVLLSLFARMTRLGEILGLLHSLGAHLQGLHSLAYLVGMVASFYPSIREDLVLCITAERLRRGRGLGLLSLGAWTDVVISVVERALLRSREVTETVLARGYRPRGPFTALEGDLGSFGFRDGAVGVVLAAVLVCVGVFLQ